MDLVFAPEISKEEIGYLARLSHNGAPPGICEAVPREQCDSQDALHDPYAMPHTASHQYPRAFTS